MSGLTAGIPQKRGHINVRGPFYAWRINYRVLIYTLICLLVVILTGLWAMTLGTLDLSMSEVADAARGHAPAKEVYAVQQLRIPRVLCAALIGAALATSGAIFQGLVRNPLVSPDVIGIDSGATVFAVVWIVNLYDRSYLPLVAFAGALLTAALIYLLSWKGGIAPDRLVLVGIGIGYAATALSTFILVRFPPIAARPAQIWTMGTIYGSNWTDVKWLSVVLTIGLIAGTLLMWPIRVMQLGDDISRGLGIPLERTRLLLIGVGCALAATAVAVAGPIGFVALMVPQVARMLAGPISGSVLLFTAVLGALFLLVADTIAQHFLPVTLPVGIITAAVGAPFFLYLLYRTSLRT